MKNREKFAKEIIDVACKCGKIAVTKDNKVVDCNDIACEECLFNTDDFGGDCSDNSLERWAESEYVDKPKISESDRQFLNYLPDNYKYIVRSRAGFLYAYDSKVEKNDKCWIGASYDRRMDMTAFKISFPMIKWEDEEPWLIEDLKKLEVKHE